MLTARAFYPDKKWDDSIQNQVLLKTEEKAELVKYLNKLIKEVTETVYVDIFTEHKFKGTLIIEKDCQTNKMSFALNIKGNFENKRQCNTLINKMLEKE